MTGTFPDNERFGLISQLRRAAISIPSNIAEGPGRLTEGEVRQFLGHARGSVLAVETQLLIAHELGFLSSVRFSAIEERSKEVGRLLNGLIGSDLSRPVTRFHHN